MSTKLSFVYFGYDFMLDTVQRLLRDGHQLIGIYTFPCDNIFNFNIQTHQLAAKLKIPITENPATDYDISNAINNECNVFLAAGYPHKIPPIDETKAYGINIHPSYLPAGRGLMPSPTILMHEHDAAGFTIHKMTQTFDGGDIIDQMQLPLSTRETIESYSARIALNAPALTSRIFEDIDDYWRLAKPQDLKKASTFPKPDDAMRTINWQKPLSEIDAKARAFGRYGVLAHFGNQLHVIYDHDMWEEKHAHVPGKMILDQQRQKVIACEGGYFNAKDFQKI